MTGFGRGCASSSSKKITVEIKSLNSKQFDAAARIPHIFREYDIEIRSRVAKALERGKVDICVAVESTATETTSTVNVDILGLYKSQLEEMGKKLGLPGPADWYSLLMHMPDAMKSEQQAAAADDYAALIEACGDAIATLREFRFQEGRKLYDFFRSKIENIGSLLVEIEPYEAERVPKIKMRFVAGIIDYGRMRSALIGGGETYLKYTALLSKRMPRPAARYADAHTSLLGGVERERPAADVCACACEPTGIVVGVHQPDLTSHGAEETFRHLRDHRRFVGSRSASANSELRDEIADAAIILLPERPLDIDILHADLAITIAYFHASHPGTVDSLSSGSDFRHCRAVGKTVFVGDEQRPVDMQPSDRCDMQLILS